MELTFNELKKRDVINIADGRCLGKIIDLKLRFPEGRLVGITVPGRRVRKFLCFFDKTEMFIDERKIIKIGGDVILVDIKCETDSSHRPPKMHPPACPPPCPPSAENGGFCNDFFKNPHERADGDDY
jgi:YlmC/YmxH family sporulation protein